MNGTCNSGIWSGRCGPGGEKDDWVETIFDFHISFYVLYFLFVFNLCSLFFVIARVLSLRWDWRLNVSQPKLFDIHFENYYLFCATVFFFVECSLLGWIRDGSNLNVEVEGGRIDGFGLFKFMDGSMCLSLTLLTIWWFVVILCFYFWKTVDWGFGEGGSGEWLVWFMRTQ